MGEVAVPIDALYGASTQRAVLNFPISGQHFPRRFIRALALVKLAAAETNGELGLLDADVAGAIAAAAASVADGDHDDQFPIDIYQTGSGTSTNTNVNEVDREPRVGTAGRWPAGPPERRRQSLSELQRHDPDRSPAGGRAGHRGGARSRRWSSCRPRSQAKADEFWPIIKTGRTHLQDATPIRLGQEFRGYAGQVENAIRRVQAARDELLTVPLGGTAVGTGINAHPEYAARRVCPPDGVARPSRPRGPEPLPRPGHARCGDRGARRHPDDRRVGLWKIVSDIRLMGMGPRAGLGELALPETQPGSSIMPGKVNPVIVESLTMVVARVVGNDTTVAFGQTGSFLELNVMLPVTAPALLESIELLAAAAANFSRAHHRRAGRDRARAGARRAGADAGHGAGARSSATTRRRSWPRRRSRAGGRSASWPWSAGLRPTTWIDCWIRPR